MVDEELVRGSGIEEDIILSSMWRIYKFQAAGDHRW